jgi:hypothetical protein
MEKGWDVTAMRPAKRARAIYGRYLVAIADRDDAVQAIQAWFPDAKIIVNSEATPEWLAACGLRDGNISELM